LIISGVTAIRTPSFASILRETVLGGNPERKQIKGPDDGSDGHRFNTAFIGTSFTASPYAAINLLRSADTICHFIAAHMIFYFVP